MKRSVLLGAVIVVGLLAIAVAAFQTPTPEELALFDPPLIAAQLPRCPL